jgi:hypothetical protein
MTRHGLSLADRFWLATKRSGYGMFRLGPGRLGYAHVIAWELVNGPMPSGLYGLHRCHNPVCVNPAHIYPGTQKENVGDAIEAGAHPAVRRAQQTHCLRGHEFTPANTRLSGGRRYCRTCDRGRYWAKQKKQIFGP